MADTPELESAYALETPEDNLRHYRAWAESYDAEFVAATGYRFPAVIAGAYLAAGGGWPCLDVGCGTGALGERFPGGAVVDGLDLSPEMLAVARQKALYRTLIVSDLTRPLPILGETYAGLVSSGTFTFGHVGPEALDELVRVMRPGALAVISVRPLLWEEKGFAAHFERLSVRVSAPGS